MAEGRLEILLLGPVEARVEGRALALVKGKQRALLALLALDANRIVSTDRLIDALWGDQPPPTASVGLYGLVSALRKVLEPASADVLVTKAPGYMLALPAASVDVARFEQLAVDGRRALAAGDVETASQRLAEALALWRGPALQDLAYLPAAQAEIARLEEARLTAIEDRIETDLAQARERELVGELEVLVAEHPLRERLRGQLMRALYGAGRQAEALEAYRAARATLVDGLGLEPSSELQALEQAILRHDPSLASLRPTPPAKPPKRRLGRARLSVAGTAAAAVAVVGIFLASGGGGRTIRLAANGVGVIRGGKIAAAGTLSAAPTDVAVTDGAVWVTSTDGHSVSRLDTATAAVQQTVRTGSGASGIAATPDAVWVVNSLEGTVSRIDLQTSTVVQTIAVGGGPAAIAAGNGAIWVTERNDQTLSRFNARSGLRTKRIPLGVAPAAVALGAGAVWVADETRGVVFRVDAKGEKVIDTIAVGNAPVDVAFGAGSVWVANNLDGTVTRIDPRTDSVEATIPVGNGPRGIAVAHEGIWVSNEFGGTLSLISPRTNRIERVVRTGGSPKGLATNGSTLFVAVRSAGASHRGGTLKVAGTAAFFTNSLDMLNGGVAATTVMTNDGLVGFRRVGGADGSQLVPDLAVALPRPTDEGRTYTFRLRRGIRYSNGRLVRPADFRRALERVFVVQHDPIFYGAIVGSRTCVAAPRRCTLEQGITTDDRARTVTFHLTEPDPDFLDKLALPYAFAVPAETPAKDIGTRATPATGPYMVRHYSPSGLTLVRNPYFHEWSRAAQPDGFPDRVVFTPVSSREREVRDVERGRSDLAVDGVPTVLEHEVETEYAGQSHADPRYGVTYLFLNTKVAPFTDVRVRRAINYAADRAAGASASSHGTGSEPACQILPPNFPGFQRYCPYTARPGAGAAWTGPDLARARDLVAKSGTRGASVTIWVSENHRGEGDSVASIFRSLGYRAHVKHVTNGRYYAPLTGPLNPKLRVQAGLFSWFADYPAPSNYIDTFFSCGSLSNWSQFCRRQIDAQIRRAHSLESSDRYLANRLWARIDRAIVDLAPVVPLYTLKQVDIVSPRVGNYQYNPPWGVLLDQLWVR